MGPRERVALRRAALAAIVGAAVVVLSGPLLLLPALAFVALTYWGHHVVWALAGDDEVPHADLAFVIVANATVVLAVQGLLFAVTFTSG